ncbi:MAG: 50S ribosomal protein L9 [Chloroflexi bacterium]|nr:50S ribosomal protein L9 [Chloroflexota bacterium]
MEVLLLKDVYKLGMAGDVKRVADGYGRNFLIPQGMAMLATPGALTQSDRIRSSAQEQRARLNQELTAVFEELNGLQLNFPVKAGETGKLYGSVTTEMVSQAIMEIKGIELDRSQIVSEPLRSLGVHTVSARLTLDLIPELTVVLHREELPPESAFEQIVEEEEEELGTFADLQAELEAEEAEKLAEDEEDLPTDEEELAEDGEEPAAAQEEPAEDVEEQALEGTGQAEQGDLGGDSGEEGSSGEEREVDPIAQEEEVETDEAS